MFYSENSVPSSSDLPPPKENKYIHLALKQDVITNDDTLEIEDEFCLFDIDSLPLFKRAKSFSIPISMDIGKKKKKFKRFIGKLSKERRHSECTSTRLR